MDISYIKHDWIEYLAANIVFCILYAFSFFIVVFLSNKLFGKKSFEQIFSELSLKKTSEGKISVVKRIHSYIQNYTFEELILFNLKYNRIGYFSHYYFGLISTIFVFISLNIPSSHAKSQLVLLSFLSPIPIIISLIFIIGVINKKAGIVKTSWDKFFYIFFVYFFKIYFIILFALVVFYIFIFIITHKWLADSSPDDYFNYLLNYFSYFSYHINYLTSYLSNFKVESVKNQLSLAGFYFTLAVGGTVVLSIIDRYFKEAESLRNKLLKQNELFKELCSKPDFSITLKLSDIISFNFKNISFKRFNIKEIVYFNNESLKNFSKKLSQIQTILECEEISNKRILISTYKSFIFLVVVTYVLGIVTIFIPDNFENYSLFIFIIDSVFFGLLISNIYISFRDNLS